MIFTIDKMIINGLEYCFRENDKSNPFLLQILGTFAVLYSTLQFKMKNKRSDDLFATTIIEALVVWKQYLLWSFIVARNIWANPFW